MPRMLWATRKVCKSISFRIKKTFAFPIVNQSRVGRENLHIIEKVETPSDPPGPSACLDIRKKKLTVTSIPILHLNFWYLLWFACVWTKLSEMYDIWLVWIKYLKIGNCLLKYNVKFEWNVASYLQIHYQSDLIETSPCPKLNIRQTLFWIWSDHRSNDWVWVAEIKSQIIMTKTARKPSKRKGGGEEEGGVGATPKEMARAKHIITNNKEERRKQRVRYVIDL